MAIRILIADDHSVVRQGLRMFLGLDPELEVLNYPNKIKSNDFVESDAYLFTKDPNGVILK